MSTHDFQEGQGAAREALQALHLQPASSQRAALLADAIGELIDVSMGWDNLGPTQDRLLGFSEVLAHALQTHPTLKRQPASRQCCTAWRRAFSRLKTLGGQI